MSSKAKHDIEIRRLENDVGIVASFPFDVGLVERFRVAFPRARWRDDEHGWFIPGVTADRRVSSWLERELGGSLAYADERGRDAFAFEPIESHYLEAGDDLVIRTPYSRTVIDQLRQVPWASWDPRLRAWRVPFRSFEALRACWLVIEIAARRAEPSERKLRRERLKASSEFEQVREREAERRRQRYPVRASELPPLGRPVMTTIGLIIFTGSDGELADGKRLPGVYEHAGGAEDVVWVFWRLPSLDELVRTWPARQPPGDTDLTRGWWQPTLEDLRAARRKARSIERAKATRRQRTRAPERTG